MSSLQGTFLLDMQQQGSPGLFLLFSILSVETRGSLANLLSTTITAHTVSQPTRTHHRPSFQNFYIVKTTQSRQTGFAGPRVILNIAHPALLLGLEKTFLFNVDEVLAALKLRKSFSCFLRYQQIVTIFMKFLTGNFALNDKLT